MLTGQAAGTLAALAVREGAQPRDVSAERVQIALLRSGSILARELMPDMHAGTLPWQAAQFAVTHDWMKTESAGFVPDTKLNRVEGAEILAFASGVAKPLLNDYGMPKQTNATYEDVPLYAPGVDAVEALNAAGISLSCNQSPKRFCPGELLTTGEFIQWLNALNARQKSSQISNKVPLRRGVVGKDNDPVTRGYAAMILYNNVEKKQGVD